MKRTLSVVCVLTVATGLALGQGSLIPPGPPAPTMKSLDQIEPRTVITNLPWTASVPGGYVVDRNLSLGAGNGISVTVSDVTIDLNGFVLTGDVAGGGHGIHVATDIFNVIIKNGVLRNWGADGVHASEAGHVTIRNLHVYGSGGNGVAMNKGELIDAVAKDCGLAGAAFVLDGTVSQDDAVIGNFKAFGNGGGGIVIEGPGEVRITDCDVSGNTGHGISWISADANETFRLTLGDVSSEHNTDDGIHVDISGAGARVRFKAGAQLADKVNKRCSGNGGHGLSIAASADADVTLQLEGADFDDNGGDGVHVSLTHADSRLHLEHRGGSVSRNVGHGYNVHAAGREANQGFFDIVVARNGGSGFREDCTSFSQARMEGVSAQGNEDYGLELVGKVWWLRRSDITGNGTGGILYEARSYGGKPYTGLTLDACRIDRNSGSGLVARDEASSDNCQTRIRLAQGTTVSGNSAHGLLVHAQNAGSVLSLDWKESQADGNGQNGVHLECDAGAGGVDVAMDGGTCDNNTGAGMRVITEDGVRAYPRPVKRITASGNGGHGIHVQGGAWRFSGCSAAGNGGDGIRAERSIYDRWGELIFETNDLVGNDGAGLNIPVVVGSATGTVVVAGGLVSGNATAGIIIGDDGVKQGSVNRVSVTGNGGHGIEIAGHDFRIEDNLVGRNAGSGIRVTGTGAHVARNQCSGNVTGIELVGIGNAARENIFGGDASQTPISATLPGNAVAPLQDVEIGTNPLGNVSY